MPNLTEILLRSGDADKMALARLLLLYMQRRFPSLRFNPSCNCEKAGDVAEATGGILAPWRVSASVVVRHLENLFGMRRDDKLGAVEAMGALARQCKIFYTQICRSELNEDARVPRAYATILDRVSQQSGLVEEVSVRSASLWPRCLRSQLWPHATQSSRLNQQHRPQASHLR